MVGTYERTAEKLLIGQRKSSTIGKLINGRFVIFKSDLSKTKQSCTWRMFWRLKQKR